VITELQIEEH